MKTNSFPVDFLGKIEIIAENKYLMMNVGLVIEQKVTESFEKKIAWEIKQQNEDKNV